MTALAHELDCIGARVEHFGAPEREGQPWPHTSRCIGCGVQRVLVIQPIRDTYALTSPTPVGVPTVHSFP